MYKFTKVDDETWKLDYNGEHEIKRDLQKAVEMQQVDFEARVLLNKKLKEMDATIDDLQYEKVVDGKKIVDDSQLTALLDDCKRLATFNKLDTLVQEIVGKPLVEVSNDLGEKDFQKFCNEFVSILAYGDTKTPSKQ